MKQTENEKIAPDNGGNQEQEEKEVLQRGRIIWILKHLALAGAILLVLGALYLGFRYFGNKMFENWYQTGNYEEGSTAEKVEKRIYKIGGPQQYVVSYNLGNLSYQRGKYDEAMRYYAQALSDNPPEGEECPVRVNFVLSMLAKYDFEHLETKEEKEEAIKTLKEGRSILCEEGCADPDGTDGHDPEAEQLKQEIDRLLQQLQDEDESESESESESETETETESETETETETDTEKKDSDNQSRNSSKKPSAAREKEIQQEMKKRRDEANKERAQSNARQDEQASQDEGEGQTEPSGGDNSQKIW